MFRKGNFVERSVVSTLTFLRDSVFADEYALKNGLLQSLDPRIKTATLFLLVLQILFIKNIVVLLFLYAVCLLLAYLSKVNLWFFLKRTWIFIPLFSLFIAVPALFSFFTPGEAIAGLHIGGLNLVVTRQGLSGASLFVTRVVASVSFVVLLGITTKHFELLKVLRTFGIPQIFVMTVGMCYRYIYLFVEIVEDTYLAIKSRVGTAVRLRRGRHIVAWNITSLWQRSYHMSEDVYKSMLSRGYRGEPAVLEDFKIGKKDWLWVFSVAIVSVLLWTI